MTLPSEADLFEPITAFSGFAVRDTAEARRFYSEVLGLRVVLNGMGILELTLPGGALVIAYPKPDHVPAGYTILNFAVADIDAAVDELNSRGVVTKIYSDPDYGTDGKGIARGRAAGRGPDIAWFRDPSGNVISVLAG